MKIAVEQTEIIASKVAEIVTIAKEARRKEQPDIRRIINEEVDKRMEKFEIEMRTKQAVNERENV